MGIAQNVQSRSQPSEIFRNAKCRGVIRRRAVSGSGCVGAGWNTRPLLVEAAEQPVGDLGHFLAAEDADQVIDLRARSTSSDSFCRSARQPETITPRSSPRALQLEHLVDRGERLRAGRLDEAAGVDDGEVGPLRVVHQLVAVELQQAEHPLAVDEVLGAAEADEGVAAFGRGAFELWW